MSIFEIFESVLFGIAGLIVVTYVWDVVRYYFPAIRFLFQLKRGDNSLDKQFFLATFFENCNVVFLTNEYDKVNFVGVDDYRFQITIENSAQPSSCKTILKPLYYATFKDLYRTVSYDLIITDKFYMLRFGDLFLTDYTEELIKEVYGDDGD